ncbi:MAG TPA: alpha/beta hydrolase [Longimicrobiales bacterium]|nr:alpha/beta hydrolase [Longimicrobiales bacterium]
MNYREAGAGDPVIFIHGFPFNNTLWQPQLANTPEGWRFIAPDLRGFGETPDDGSKLLAIETFADDVIALMDELGLDQAVLVGLSMGGYVVLDIIKRYPDRVRALVLTATRANADNAEARANRHSLAAASRRSGTRAVIEAMLPHLISAHSRLKMPELIKTVHGMMESTSPETMARALEEMAERKDYVADLANINVSTIIIRGDQDDIIPAAEMETIARSVRGARHEVITLAGHLPNLENPELFNKLLGSFLSYLPPALKLGDFSLSF